MLKYMQKNFNEDKDKIKHLRKTYIAHFKKMC